MSDKVDSAILKNMHVTSNPLIVGKMWSNFEVAAQNKKVILYGLNGLLNFIWMRCDKNFDIVAAIDNDPEKQKYKLGDLFDETDLKSAANLPIQPKTVLKNYDPNDVVILISNFRYVDEIANELDESGFNCYFSVLQLEYYFRTYMKENNLHIEDQNEFLNRYAQKIASEYPIQQNKVIISMGTYAEHGKYVTAQLLKMNEDIDIVWTVNNQNMEYPKGVRIVSSAKSKQLIKEMETAYKYFAFISYNSKDTKWVKRLQRKLENYRMPAALCSERGWKRTPIRPVFFAPTDIQGGGLSAELQKRLSDSQNLIVICSPNSAKSQWVGKEIEFFHSLGRTENIH